MSTQFIDARELKAALVSEGWKTPETYASQFQEIADIPAVYLFLLFKDFDFSRGLVAYVGMSTRLRQRLSNHPVLSKIDGPSVSVMRWFKPVTRNDLRAVEARYITSFDPPWNIIGRPRGIVLQ